MAKAITFYQMVFGQYLIGRPIAVKDSPIDKGVIAESKVDNNNRFEVVEFKAETGEIIMREMLPENAPEGTVAKVVTVTKDNAIAFRYIMNPNPKPAPDAILVEENGKNYLVVNKDKRPLGKIAVKKIMGGYNGEVILGVKTDDDNYIGLQTYDSQVDKFGEIFATVSNAAEIVVVDGKTFIIDNIIENVPQFDNDGNPVLDANNNQVIKRRVVDIALYEYRGKGYLRKICVCDYDYDEDDYDYEDCESNLFEVPIKSMRLIEQGQRKDLAIVTTEKLDDNNYLVDATKATITLLRADDYSKVGTFYVNDPEAKIYLGGSFGKAPVVTVKDADQILIRDNYGLKVVDDAAVVAAMDGYNYFCATEVKKDEDDNNVVIFTYANAAMEVKSFKMTDTDRGLLFDMI